MTHHTQALAAAMGGEVACKSELGSGSTFSVVLRLRRIDDAADVAPATVQPTDVLGPLLLESRAEICNLPEASWDVGPLQPREPNVGEEESKGQDPSSLSSTLPPLVLLVDDVKANLRLWSLWIEKSKLPVRFITASDGKKAVSLWREHRTRIKAIFMDINMPEMNGIDATRYGTCRLGCWGRGSSLVVAGSFTEPFEMRSRKHEVLDQKIQMLRRLLTQVIMCPSLVAAPTLRTQTRPRFSPQAWILSWASQCRAQSSSKPYVRRWHSLSPAAPRQALATELHRLA